MNETKKIKGHLLCHSDRQRVCDYDFLLYTHTKKFHFPACPGVNQMNEKNKSFTDEPREELIARGYTPCGQCDP